MIIFGGQNEDRQISVVYKGGIKRIGTLPFDFIQGRCHFDSGNVYLCFSAPSNDQDISKRTCHKRYA